MIDENDGNEASCSYSAASCQEKREDKEHDFYSDVKGISPDGDMLKKVAVFEKMVDPEDNAQAQVMTPTISLP